MNKETRESAIHTSPPAQKIVIVHFPFQMCAERRVHIELEPFWDYIHQWAREHNVKKEHGHYTGQPPI